MISKLFRLWSRLKWLNVGEALLGAYGVLWLIVSILVFFGKQTTADKLSSLWWLFIILGFIYTFVKNWPKSSYAYDVKNRDVSIAINISDIFKLDGAKIIPINNRFDTSGNGIVNRSSSILKIFIKKIYNGNNQHLSTDIKNQIEDNSNFYNSLITNSNPQKEYKIGTVVPVFQDEKQS